MCGCARRMVTMRTAMQNRNRNKQNNKPIVQNHPLQIQVQTPVLQKNKPQGRKLNNVQRAALLNRLPPAMRRKLMR